MVLDPHQFIARLPDSPIAQRWITLRADQQTSHLVHLLPPCHDNAERRRFLSAAEPLARIDNAHLLTLEAFGFAPDARPYTVTPYPGTHDGLLTLEALAHSKPHNRLAPAETERAITHILDAVQACHHAGLHNGPFLPDQLLVDPRGAVLIEHYGFNRKLQGLAAADREVVADELRSVAEIAYRLFTGVAAGEPLIPVARLVRKCPPAWARWFDIALDPAAGFATPAEALEALPARAADAARPPARDNLRVRAVFGRVRGLAGAPRTDADLRQK